MLKVFNFFLKFQLYIFLAFTSSNVFGETNCSVPKMPSEKEWDNWIIDISNEAINYGINEVIVKNEISKLKPIKKIIQRDRCQPESTISFKEYL